MKAQPKVLIISGYTFDGHDATSITLKNLFSNWDSAKIAFLHVVSTPINNNKINVMQVYFRRLDFLYKLFYKKKLVEKIREEKSIVHGLSGAIQTNSFRSKIFNIFHTFIASHRALIPYTYTKDIDKFIKEFKPDVIYSPLGSIGIMRLACSIAKKENLRIVPHFMDDWIATMYSKNPLLLFPKLVKSYYLNRVLKRALNGFAISEEMAKEYSEKFHKPFFALMNCVSYDDFPESEVKNEKKKLVFSYCGGLHLNRWKSLAAFCIALEKFKIHKNYELHVYTNESDWILLKNKIGSLEFVKHYGFLPYKELRQKQMSHDFLIHVESFDENVIKYTKLSVSTKIPEYLSLRKPIIAIGPKNIASIRYLRENNCALVVDSLNDDKLISLINQVNNEELINQLAINARKLFIKNHTLASQTMLLENQIKTSTEN